MCQEDMRTFYFISGKNDGQKDKLYERQKDRMKDRQAVQSWTEMFACFFRAITLICPEDMRMYHFTFGKKD
jgi:hypothetical protein